MLVSLKPVTKDDLSNETLVLLLRGAPPAYVLREQEGGGIVCAILKDGEIVGVMMVTRDGELMVSILEDFQRQGIGSRVLDLLKPLAAERAFTSLTARALPNRGGSKLMLKAGAEEVGREDGEVLYRLQLADN